MAFYASSTHPNQFLGTTFHAVAESSSPSSKCVSTINRQNPPRVIYNRVTVKRSPSNRGGSSLYEVLGIEMSATGQEIKTAYRRLARVLHPDVAPIKNDRKDDTTTAAVGVGNDFIEVNKAYVTLSDPKLRADYDRTLFLQRRYFPVLSSYSAGYTRRSWETDQCW